MNAFLPYQDYIRKHFSPALKLAVLLVNGNIPERIPEEVDWDEFVSLSIRHRLYPFYDISGLMKAKILPERAGKALKDEHRGQTMRMMPLASKMVCLDNMFKEHNIHILWMKGPVLSQQVYGNVNARVYTDLDALIDPVDFEKTKDLLINQGFKAFNFPENMNRSEKKVFFHFRNQADFIHPSEKIMIEIHWRTANPNGFWNIPYSELAGTCIEIPIAGHPVHTFCNEHNLLFLLTHGSRHQFAMLCWLKDVDSFIRKAPVDYGQVYKTADKWGLGRVVYQSLILTRLVFETPLPEGYEQFYDHAARKLILRGLEGINNDIAGHRTKKISHFISVFYLMRLKESFRYRFNALAKLSINPDDWIQLRLPLYLFPLYFFIRPFTWFYRAYVKSKKK